LAAEKVPVPVYVLRHRPSRQFPPKFHKKFYDFLPRHFAHETHSPGLPSSSSIEVFPRQPDRGRGAGAGIAGLPADDYRERSQHLRGAGEHDDLVVAVALACWWAGMRQIDRQGAQNTAMGALEAALSPWSRQGPGCASVGLVGVWRGAGRHIRPNPSQCGRALGHARPTAPSISRAGLSGRIS
jgi:hypothetical protein